MQIIDGNTIMDGNITAVSSQDLLRAMQQPTPRRPAGFDPIIYGGGQVNLADFRKEYEAEFNPRPTGGPITRKVTMLNTATANIVRGTGSSNYSLTTTYDESVWKLEVPGVEYEDIEVYTVKDVIHVDVKGRNFPTFQLAEDETLDSVTLDLGILTVTIDRPFKRIDIEVG